MGLRQAKGGSLAPKSCVPHHNQGGGRRHGARCFGILSVNGAAGPVAAHAPFELGEGEAFVHLAWSSPIARMAPAAPELLAVSGPDAYASPDW
jgi:predicted FMN-binding regulatory protein PaiB